MTRCDRCGRETRALIMSYFNTDDLCPDCRDLEEQHPDFEEARSVEVQFVQAAVQAGTDVNYQGIGLPAGYDEWADSMRRHTEAIWARDARP